MIDAKRNLNTTYRLDRRLDGVYIRTFPPAPEAVAEAWYRTDQIPQWLLEAMALLDAAAPANVSDIGHRVGEMVYWIEPPLRDTAGHRIAAMLSPLDHNRGEALLGKWTDESHEAVRVRYEKTP